MSSREKLLYADHNNLPTHTASLKGLSVTCRHNKGQEEEFGAKQSLGEGEEKVFSLSVFSISLLMFVLFLFPNT